MTTLARNMNNISVVSTYTHTVYVSSPFGALVYTRCAWCLNTSRIVPLDAISDSTLLARETRTLSLSDTTEGVISL